MKISEAPKFKNFKERIKHDITHNMRKFTLCMEFASNNSTLRTNATVEEVIAYKRNYKKWQDVKSKYAFFEFLYIKFMQRMEQ